MPSRNRARERAKALPHVAQTAALGAAGAGHGQPIAVSDLEHLRRLADTLLNEHRTNPVAVISIPAGHDRPWIDADAVADALASLVPVYVITNAMAWALTGELPALTQVYGGAGRVYPLGLDWTRDPYQSPLRFAYSAQDGPHATDQLIGDGLRMARTNTNLPTPTSATRTVPASGVVAGLVGSSRALVRLEDASMASVWSEMVADVPVDRLLRVGQPVTGELDVDTRRLDLRAQLLSPQLAAAQYNDGDVVLAQVRSIQTDEVHLAVHPELVVQVPRRHITTNPRDRLEELFTHEDTVLARFTRDELGAVHLRLDDVDEDTPVPTLALLPGGPPWLVDPGDDAPPDAPVAQTLSDVAADHPTVPQPAPRVSVQQAPARTSTTRSPGPALEDLAALSAQVAGLEQQVAWLSGERQRLLEQVAAQKRHLLRKVQSTGKPARAADESPAADGPYPAAYDDPGDQLRFEVELEWATRIPASQKGTLPLCSWSIGPDFLASLEAVQGVPRRTVVRVIVEVLTGLASQLPGRDLHLLRSGPGAGDPVVQRDDGAVCWRVALQQGSASARRLHYWKNADWVELSRVVLHDDMRP